MTLLPWLLSLAVGAEHARLGSADFTVRDAAHARLARWGVWGQLVAVGGPGHPDAEVRRRCEDLAHRRTWYVVAGHRELGPLGAMAALSLTSPEKWSQRVEGRFWCHDPQRLQAIERTAVRLRLLKEDELPAWSYPPCWRGCGGQEGATCGVINACRMRFRGETIPGYGE